MQRVLQDFRDDSPVWWANRKADGMSDIDAAVAGLDANWVANGGASLLNAGFVEHLLNTANAWLTGRKVFGQQVTGWRVQAIRRLYWRVAWCWLCDHYAQRAREHVNLNLGAGLPTAVTAPVPHASPVGSPYQFANSEYAHEPLPQPPRVLRGDSRGPLAIAAANGFQPRNIMNRWNYAPWFAGNATGDTISVTTDEGLAIDAGPAAYATGMASPEGPLPAWLAPLLPQARRGYVYEFGNLGLALSTRVAEGATGRENIFLALPAATISNWWVVLVNRQTYGPFPLAALGGPAAPPGAQLSAAHRQLA